MNTAMNAAVTDGTWSIRCLRFVVEIGCHIALGTSIASFFLILVITFSRFLVPACAHTNITSDAHPAALFGDDSADEGTFCESRELLSAVDGEWLGAHFETKVNMGLWSHRSSHGFVGSSSGCCRGCIFILGLFDLLVQVEVESVLALMSNGQIRKDEVAGGIRTVEIGHASDRHTSKDGHWLRSRMYPGLIDGTGGFEGSEEEEVGIVCVGNILLLFAFEDS